MIRVRDFSHSPVVTITLVTIPLIPIPLITIITITLVTITLIYRTGGFDTSQTIAQLAALNEASAKFNVLKGDALIEAQERAAAEAKREADVMAAREEAKRREEQWQAKGKEYREYIKDRPGKVQRSVIE